MYRKTAYIVARIIGLIIVALMACIYAIQTPRVQTGIASKATEKLLEAFGGNLSYDDLQIMPSGALIIRNAVLTDDSPFIPDSIYCESVQADSLQPADTVFRAGTITATFSLGSILKSEGLHFGRVAVEDAMMHLCSEPGEYKTNLARIFKIVNDGVPPEPGPEIFRIAKVSVRNFRFRLNDYTGDSDYIYSGTGINYQDLDLTADIIKGHRLRFAGARMYAVCDELSLREKSGYVIEHLSGSCAVGMGKAEIEDIHLIDPWSDLKLEHYSMSYADDKAFNNYEEEVLMSARFRDGKVAFKTLSYFTGAFADSQSVIHIHGGNVKGYVNDLHISGFDFEDEYSKVSGLIDCKLLGLPDISIFSIDSRVNRLRFTTRGLSQLLSGLTDSKIDLSSYAPGQRMSLSASVRGPLNRLYAHGTLRSGIGSVKLDADLRNLIDRARAIEATASIETDNLDLGILLGQEQLGELSAGTRLSAIIDKDNPQITLDSLGISRMVAMGNSFRNVFANGELSQGRLTAAIESFDPKVRCNLNSMVNLNKEASSRTLRLEGAIEQLDLRALGIDERNGISKIKLDIDTDLSLSGKVIEGLLKIQDIVTENGGGVKEQGNITLSAYTDDKDQCFKLESEFADVFLSGSGTITDFITELQELTTRRELSAIYRDSSTYRGHNHYNVDVLLHDSRDILSYVSPGVYISDSTSITMSIESNGELYGNMYSPRLAYSNNFIRDVDLQFDNLSGSLNVAASSSEFKAGNFVMRSPDIIAYADDNDVQLSAGFESFAGAGGSGRIYIDGMLYRDQNDKLVIKANPHDSYIATGDGVWEFSDSDIMLHGKDFYIHKFSLSNGNQLIGIDGGISEERRDTLSIRLEKFDMAIVDDFLADRLDLQGVADGQVFLTSTQSQAKGMLMDIKLDSLSLGGVDAGWLQIASILEDEGESINIYLRNEIEGRDALYANGLYYLDDGHMDISAELDRMPLGVAGPFLKDILSETDGTLSGELRLQGLGESIQTSSKDLVLENAKLKVAYTGVPYTVNGPVRLDTDGIHLESLDIRDDSGGSATLGGKLLYNEGNPTLEARLSLLNIKLLDEMSDVGTGVYGLLRGSGSAQISGPLPSLMVNADLSTVGDGNIHISTNNSSTSTSSNLLSFTKSTKDRDPYEDMLISFNESKAVNNDINIQARVRIRPEVRAYVEIDKSAGNVASFSGSGTIDLHLRPSRSIFNINGDFNVNEGNYKFVLPGIMNKDFQVQNGSSIKFAGDILDTELNINVIHSLQTSLSAIIPSSTTNKGTRRLVECGIAITERLRDPKMDFSINIPDLDPTTKSQVETALSTEDKIQKQFIALLLMGSFMPDEASGVFNGSDVLLSNVSELMSNQINSILQKLEIPLDMGIGYQGLTDGTNMFDVAISTQLFNNRVIVGGSVKNRRLQNNVSTAEVVGDLDIQIKLDKQGQFRLNLFSHSADEYSSFLDLSQRNGGGISYQQEFNKFGDFFRDMFKSRKQKEQEALQAPADTEMVIIKIEEENDEERQALPDSSAVGR